MIMPKILIVEDDKHILTGLEDNLAMAGYKTVIARDGREALAQAKDKSPDLIILDIMLPKLDGFEVCRELRKSGSNVPIIILSARAQESDKVLGLELGADDYVTKPFSPRELLTRVKTVLRRVEMTNKVDDVFVFGPETRGLPAEILAGIAAERRLRLPMRPGNRSINLSNTVAIVAFEAWRQLDFAGGS